MAVWKLSPIDLKDPNWQASSHRAPAVVRAADEAAARDIAARAFDVPTRHTPAMPMLAPPWRRRKLVRAEEIDDPRYPADGPAGVLEPSV